MHIGNVYQINFPISHYGKVLNSGDIIEIIDLNSISGPCDAYVGRYSDRQTFNIDVRAIQANGQLLSHSPLDVHHPLRNPPKKNDYTSLSANFPGYGLNGAFSGDGLGGIDMGSPPGMEKPLPKKCHCGCASIGVNNHSDYCPLYTKE